MSLPETVAGWFSGQMWASFSDAHPHERPGSVHRAENAREILVRTDASVWAARSLCPSAFPIDPVALRAKQDAVAAQYEAHKRERDPQERHKRLQEQWAREREALKGTPEQRAAVQAEVKQRVGLTPIAPTSSVAAARDRASPAARRGTRRRLGNRSNANMNQPPAVVSTKVKRLLRALQVRGRAP